MTVYFEKFTFTAAPHTDAQWILDALRESAIFPHLGSLGTVSVPEEIDPLHGTRVTQICHPCTWLRGHWLAGCPKVGIDEVDVLATLNTATFAHFVNSYLDICKGAVGRVFDRYLKNADTVIKLEEQPRALGELLDTLGFRAEQFRHVGEIAVNKLPDTPSWPRRLYSEVCEAEQDFRERYEY